MKSLYFYWVRSGKGDKMYLSKDELGDAHTFERYDRIQYLEYDKARKMYVYHITDIGMKSLYSKETT